MFSLFEGSDSEDAGAGTAPPVAVTVAFDAAHAHVVRVTRGHLAPLTDALRDRDAAETAASFRAAYLAVAQRDCAGCLATARVLTKQAWDRLQAHAHREGSREDDGDDEKTDRLVWRDVYIIAQYLTAICLLDPRRIGDETASAAQRATEAADRAFTVGASIELTQQLVELADLWLPPCCAPAGGANATIPPCDVALIAGAPAIERCADLPTIAHFAQRFFEPRRPVVLEGLASDWPAATKWADVSHFKNAHGRRLVPVEVGRHQEGAWTEELMTFRAFVDEFLLPSNARGVVPLERTKGELRQVGYLAQHALFAQVRLLLFFALVSSFFVCSILLFARRAPSSTPAAAAAAAAAAARALAPFAKAWFARGGVSLAFSALTARTRACSSHRCGPTLPCRRTATRSAR